MHEPLQQPLCSFRAGEFAALGYALFCVLALIGALYAFDMKRYGEPGEAANTASFGVLLAIIVATPDYWSFHKAAAMVLLTSIYAYFAMLLYRCERQPLMWLHLSIPLVLAVATGFQSYGMWQKALVCYLILEALIHHHHVKRTARFSTPSNLEARKANLSSKPASAVSWQDVKARI